MPIILANSPVEISNFNHGVEKHGQNSVHCFDLKLNFRARIEFLALLLESTPGANEAEMSGSFFFMAETAEPDRPRGGFGKTSYKARFAGVNMSIARTGVVVGTATGATLKSFSSIPSDGGMFEIECSLRVKGWTDALFAACARCVQDDGVTMHLDCLEQASFDLEAKVGPEPTEPADPQGDLLNTQAVRKWGPCPDCGEYSDTPACHTCGGVQLEEVPPDEAQLIRDAVGVVQNTKGLTEEDLKKAGFGADGKFKGGRRSRQKAEDLH